MSYLQAIHGNVCYIMYNHSSYNFITICYKRKDKPQYLLAYMWFCPLPFLNLKSFLHVSTAFSHSIVFLTICNRTVNLKRQYRLLFWQIYESFFSLFHRYNDNQVSWTIRWHHQSANLYLFMPHYLKRVLLLFLWSSESQGIQLSNSKCSKHCISILWHVLVVQTYWVLANISIRQLCKLSTLNSASLSQVTRILRQFLRFQKLN